MENKVGKRTAAASHVMLTALHTQFFNGTAAASRRSSTKDGAMAQNPLFLVVYNNMFLYQ